MSEIWNDELEKKLVDKINENIDIPIINEKPEEKYISALVSTIKAVISKFYK